MTDTAAYLKDSQGRLVPVTMVREIDQIRDELVKKIVEKAQAQQAALAVFKRTAMDDIQAFVDLSASEFGVEYGGVKGNVTLTSFDGQYRVQRAIDEYIVFDERLSIAKSLIDECISEWSEGSRDEIRVLINDAFQVDQTGRVNTKRILGLRRLNIQDAKWRKAMDAIGESIQVTGSKSYVRIYERQTDGAYRQISLDLASI